LSGIDKEESVFALLRERLDVIEQSVTKLHLHENRTEQQKQFCKSRIVWTRIGMTKGFSTQRQDLMTVPLSV